MSANHLHETAQALIEKLEMREQQTILSQSPKSVEPLSTEICSKWHPPETTGYQLVRIHVPVTNKGLAREITCWCSSGNQDFDQSALTLLKKTKYKTLVGSTGLLDFAFVAEDGKTSVSSIVYCGSVVP